MEDKMKQEVIDKERENNNAVEHQKVEWKTGKVHGRSERKQKSRMR